MCREGKQQVSLNPICGIYFAYLDFVVELFQALEARMSKYRIALVLGVAVLLLAGGFFALSDRARPSQASESEQAIWKLEHEYWHHVQDNDVSAYLALWHKDFLGWPWVNAEPVRKDHITDWITSNTSKGLAFKSIELKPTGVQVTGDIAVAYYGMTYKWVDKDGKGAAVTIRVTHTWLKAGKDWQIIGGMSAREPVPSQN